MSITFTIAGQGRPADCCCIPWDKDCTHCGKDRNDCTCMDGPGLPCKPCDARPQLNVSNVNARDILYVLNLPCEGDLYGEVRSRDLTNKITALLKKWEFTTMAGTVVVEDAAREGHEQGGVTECARREGYMSEKLNQLLKICQEAGPLGRITWA